MPLRHTPTVGGTGRLEKGLVTPEPSGMTLNEVGCQSDEL
jgi:hypothetical protein